MDERRPPAGPLDRSVAASRWSAEPVDQAGRWLGWAWHVMVAVLVAAGTVRAVAIDSGSGPWLVGSVLASLHLVATVTGSWFDFGSTEDQRGPRQSAWSGRLPLAGLVATGIAVALYPDAYVWLAFPVGLVVFHRLSLVRSVVAGIVLAFACVSALARVDSLTGPRILGPLLGLAVAAAGAIAIRTLQAEAHRRWSLVIELRETHDLVALRERESGILQERARLARDIHDTVAQGLSSILMLTAAVQRELVDPAPEIVDHLAQIDEVAREDLAATRRLIADLSPAELEHFDLAHALRRRAERVRGSAGVQVEVALDEVPAMSRDLEVAVLRIVGQALDNAVVHGKPSRVRISMATVGDALVIDVHDDGTGFDPSTAAGRGIDGMRARAEGLGGRLTIESHPDGGTVVAAELPLDTWSDQAAGARESDRPEVVGR